MRFVLLALLVSACTDDDTATMTTTQRDRVAFVCYTHASCTVYDATARNVVQHICVKPDKAQDALVPGDAAASSWASQWRGSCAALEGTIGGPDEGRVCAYPDELNPSTLDPAPYECTVDCEPMFEGC